MIHDYTQNSTKDRHHHGQNKTSKFALFERSKNLEILDNESKIFPCSVYAKYSKDLIAIYGRQSHK